MAQPVRVRGLFEQEGQKLQHIVHSGHPRCRPRSPVAAHEACDRVRAQPPSSVRLSSIRAWSKLH
ncbi:hypothetical protein DKG71_01825 [Streptomyces sp. NEAU-S7GS2]|nr:hypothetical protein DKG71_01825 [Streptomyces sp. NEAU-S7GS2]